MHLATAPYWIELSLSIINNAKVALFCEGIIHICDCQSLQLNYKLYHRSVIASYLFLALKCIWAYIIALSESKVIVMLYLFGQGKFCALISKQSLQSFQKTSKNATILKSAQLILTTLHLAPPVTRWITTTSVKFLKANINRMEDCTIFAFYHE